VQKSPALVIPSRLYRRGICFAACEETADSLRDNSALRNDNLLGISKSYERSGKCCLGPGMADGAIQNAVLKIRVEGELALQLCQITVFAVVTVGGTFDELQEMTQIFPLGGFEFGEFNADTERWAALGHDPGKNESLDPDLSIRQPEADFDGDS
jgi:hypothetical protein